MAIHLKTDRDVEGLRRAAGVVGAVLAEVAQRVEPGATTAALDHVAEEIIRDAGGRPAFKGYRMGGDTPPFPGAICASLNDVVVHGFPTDRPLEEGDLLAVDCGVELDGYFGDYAYTFPVGEVSEENRALLNATKQSLYEGIREAVAGRRIGDIGYAVQRFCEARGYGVVRDLVGHGIGRQLHEEPQVPNTGRRGQGKRLKEGMALCIEPMINQGTERVTVDADGWTVRTADGRPSAHYEHMVVVRRGAAEVLSSYDAVEAALRARGAWVPGTEAPVSLPADDSIPTRSASGPAAIGAAL
ncbi:MAG: type I methionyl aminopeptidase [Rubricoccaceae bacterium]|nr:type I methionyl aminopeptidase [Rubricoccaceae bacterium]